MTSPKPVCLDDFEHYAVRTLPRATLGYFRGGADNLLTVADNVNAFKRLNIVPRVLRDVSRCCTKTTILGRHDIEFPICVAPTAYHRLVHPDGEVATAKAAAACGTAMMLSSYATSTLEEVATACSNSPLFFQLYVCRDRHVTKQLIQRVERAGYSAIFLTVDVPTTGKRRADFYNDFHLPPHVHLPNLGVQKSNVDQSLADFVNHYADPKMTWDILQWLKSITRLPIIVKGILTPEDSIEAVRHGASAIVVSNHGGRQLDTVPATIDVLADVVKAVNGRCEVYMDGGVRTGTDVFKALALGAKAVFIGRPIVYGLAYNGEEGVKQVLEIIRDEFRSTMQLAGCSSLSDIKESYIRRSFYSRL